MPDQHPIELKLKNLHDAELCTADHNGQNLKYEGETAMVSSSGTYNYYINEKAANQINPEFLFLSSGLEDLFPVTYYFYIGMQMCWQ
jgi:hypothetical protein